MQQPLLRIALVGCGQIADAHLQEVRKIKSAQLAAVCDRQIDLARQAGARFGVPNVFDDLDRMLEAIRPDVLHVTTPPHTHASLACLALERGVHVYIEKPFTLDVAEADDVIRVARASRRLVCVGHDQLFDPLWQECRQLYRRGKLGDIVHIDSVQPYDLTGPFGRVVVADPDHWVHRLPGKLFQNTISHPLYKITDFLPDEDPEIWAMASAPVGCARLPTELRVFLQGQRVSGQLLFSSTIRPLNRVVRLFGTKQTLEIDFDAGLIRPLQRVNLPGALGRVESPCRSFVNSAKLAAQSMWRFLRCRIHYFAGMRLLFEAFYQAIREGTEPPITCSEIRRVTCFLDRIFQASKAKSGHSAPPPEPGWRESHAQAETAAVASSAERIEKA